MANLTMLLACDPNRLIGNSATNGLPWHMPEDLKLFRTRTLDHAIIMGRKTWDSLQKRPLERRTNIVVSRSISPNEVVQLIEKNEYAGVMCGSLETAISYAQSATYDIDTKKYDKDKEIFLIGGCQLFQVALDQDLANKAIISHLCDCYEGDIFFPAICKQGWSGFLSTRHAGFDVWIYHKKSSY